jgi:hypothetical protein
MSVPVTTFKPEVLEELARHGLAPGPSTPPERLREQINDLYRIEIRRLRDRYMLLSIPIAQWTVLP